MSISALTLKKILIRRRKIYSIYTLSPLFFPSNLSISSLAISSSSLVNSNFFASLSIVNFSVIYTYWASVGEKFVIYDFQPEWNNNQINFNILAIGSNSEAKIYVFAPKTK